MGKNGLLNSLNIVHLFALHYVYLPRINASLGEFKLQWNHHRIRTANHQTPLALFQVNINAIPTDPVEVRNDVYGIDYGGPLPDITTNKVVVPEEHSFIISIHHTKVSLPKGSLGLHRYMYTTSL